MKSLLRCFVCLAALGVGVRPVLAQTSGGIDVGANFNRDTFSGAGSTGLKGSNKTGVIGGAFLTLKLNGMVTIMPEVAYAQRHAKLTAAAGGGTFTQTLQIDAIEIPVLAKFTPANAQGFYVVAGPGFNFRTRAKATDSTLDGQSSPSQDQDLKSTTASTDVSLIGGAGFTRNRIGIEVRYDHGLRNLDKDPKDQGLLEVKERAVTLLLRWFIR